MNIVDHIAEFAKTGVVPPICLARCCECFHISNESLEMLENDPDNVQDGHYIKDMLIELPHEVAKKCHESWGFKNWEPEEGEHYFTCKHWDAETRLCKAYEDRPKMCRDHPQGVCKHGCGLSG